MDPFIGQIMMFAGNFAPRSWAFCNGQLLAISQNTALFSILGTTYGGDGRTTFALPDLRGRSPIHPGNGPGLSTFRLGQRGGSEQHTLNIAQMPNHAHSAGTLEGTVKVNEEDATTDDPQGASLGIVETNYYNSTPPNTLMAANNVGITGNTAATGGNQSFNIRNPYEGVNYIIALFGIFPSRS